ncbi:MAG: DNA polymerase/3'-5' exonuclease PolX [Phycisphaerales bacterium]|nr:DNA polymerase/3'-5' exonuclease PolX [Phycisphaerales bacterium]
MDFNHQLAAVFERIGQMLELTGADKFRVNAHLRAARVVADHPTDLGALADLSEKQAASALRAIEGIGAKTADKIIEFRRTGRIAEHDELAASVPAGLLEMLAIPGLGPKTVKAIWETLGVTDPAGLRRAIDDGSIMTVPRMGAKTVENIRKSMAFAASASQRTAIGLAMPLAERIVGRLAAAHGVRKAWYAGSLRRGRDTVGDLDFLASTDDSSAVAGVFTGMPEVREVLAAGKTKCSVRLELESGATVQADLRFVAPDSAGAALIYFTGSKEFNVRLRERALKRGFTLNEYGLFPLDDRPDPPQSRGVKAVAAASEAEVFQRLGLPEIPPELREDRGDVFDAAPAALIDVSDIRAELHAHTTASDGVLTIAELAAAARDRGFHTIAVTDHSQSSVIASGLKPDRLRRHIAAVREAAEAERGITILAGSEVDILSDGSLDYPDDLLAELDIVIASPHAGLRQDPEAATVRMVAAARHPLVHIIGHPTGRLIGRREGFFPDIGRLAEAAAECGTALEINANWMRLDLRDTHVRAALDAGCQLAINCDVHHPDDFDNLRYGVITGRRGGLTAERCINTWTAAKLRTWLKGKR